MFEQLPERTLLWCALEHDGIRHHAWLREFPHGLARRSGRFAPTQRHRQQCPHDLADGMAVVFRRPTRQRQHVLREERGFIQHAPHALQFGRRDVRVRRGFQQHADHIALAEWHAYAHAGAQGRGIHIGRRQVIEVPVKRRGHRHAQVTRCRDHDDAPLLSTITVDKFVDVLSEMTPTPYAGCGVPGMDDFCPPLMTICIVK